ncbi:MAG: choice-of-anchor D domain-containing protein [Chitinophagales bacterium]|nr:choice-of-anchor D domain-containing protein [Chitinophagales bacterium]
MKRLFTFFFLFLAIQTTYSQVSLAQWPLTTNGSPSSVDPDVVAGNFTNGSGISAISYGTNGAFSSGWSTGALNANDYFEIQIEPAAGFNLEINEVLFSERRSGTGIRDYQVRWSTNASFSSPTTIATVNVPDNTSDRSGNITGLNIIVNDGETLYLRFYGYNAEAAGGTWRIKDASLELLGVVNAASGCSISSSGIANILCHDNGSSGTPADDYLTFDLNVSAGSGTAASYTLSVSGGGASSVSPSSGTYGVLSSFSLNTGSANGSDVSLTITDATTGSCTLVETISDPGSCSVPVVPTLTLSTATLSALDYQFGNGPSASQSFVLTGANLSSDISINAPSNFLVSSDNINFSSSLTIPLATANGSHTLYVQLEAGLAISSYSGSLSASSSPASTQNLSLDGTVSAVPAGCVSVFSDDFSGGLTSWSNTSDWTISSGELKHNLSGVAGSSYIYSDIASQDLSLVDAEWNLCIRNGAWDPSSSNKFAYFLISSSLNLLNTPNGYAVGVNQIGTSDFLELYQVSGGSYTSIISSSFDWNSSDDVCIRVSRTSTGDWELFYNANGGGEASAGTASDLTFTSGQYTGATFEYSTARAGLLWIDDIDICASNLVANPEIDVQGNGQSIADNDLSPSLSDDTDFGSVLVSGGPIVKTYTIFNTGTADLDITSLSSSNAVFSIGGISPPLSLAPAGSTTFTVSFDPAVTGIASSNILINNNDPNEDSYEFLVQGNGTAIPDIVLSSANPAAPALNLVEGANNNVVYAFSLAVSTYDATLTAFDFVSSGTAVSSNFTNFKAYYSNDASLNVATDIFLDNETTSLGAGTHSFSGFAQTIANGSTGYIFITCDLPCPSTAGNTLQIEALTTANLSFSNGNKTGSAFASGLHTIVDDVPINVTGAATSACENGSSTITWTNATGCFDNYLVVASLSSLVSTPSGNGVSYSADSNFGAGTAFDDGYVVYKNNGTSVSVNGLSNGTNYIYTIFTRNGSTWSSGVEVNCTPVSPIPDNACGSNELSQSITYSSAANIADINVFVSIEHTWRSDLHIELESPSGTIAQLFNGSNSGSENNLEVIFDDAGTGISATSHTIDGIADETIISDVDPLSVFNGESSDGIWTLRVCDDASGDIGFLVDWSLDITDACIPTHSFTSLIPASGVIGTEITVIGTGFSATTEVYFGALAATSISFVSSDTLKVIVPTGASTGALSIEEASCAITSSIFSVLSNGGPCNSSSFSDLIISEVYDADLNNVWYVELYNPTSVAIDLAAEDYELDRYSSLVALSPARTIDLVGVVPAFGVFVLDLGTSTATCSYPWDLVESGGGINEEDRNVLTKGGMDVDAVSFPNETGYSIRRKSFVSGPTPSYNASDWDLFLNESCDDLGLAPVSATLSPEITNSLSNQEACNLDFTVLVTEGDSSTLGDISYTWYFNDQVNANWLVVNSTNLPNLNISGEDSGNLTISSGIANIKTIDGYQFYCEITEAALCTDVSNAASFTFAPERYFRTKASGNWDDLNSWQMASSLLGPWSDACDFPDSDNSDYISIEAGHELILNLDVQADQIIIQSLGKLVLNEKLSVTNGDLAAHDLEVIGTLQDNGTSANGIAFLNGATWLLDADGIIIKTNNSSVNNYRDNYESGIANIPASAHWAFVYDGSGAVAVGSIDMFYPNLYFESTAGAHDAQGVAEFFQGFSGYPTVKGDLVIGAGSITGASNPYKVYYNNTNSQPMIVEGDVYIESGSEFTNALAGGAQPGTGVEIKGDLIANGNWTLLSDTGLTKLSGSTKQFISGSGRVQSSKFELANIDNAELAGIDLEITNKLIFTDGKLITNVASADLVYVKNASPTAITGYNTAGNSKYVEGKLQWLTDGSSSYTFPVGEEFNGVQAFTVALTGTAGSEILGYLETNTTSPLYPHAYCDLETPNGGSGQIGTGIGTPDGTLDQITFNLASPLQWDITNPNGGISAYNLTVLANGTQDISPIVSTNTGIEIRYLMKNGEPGNTGVATSLGAPSFNTNGFAACPNQYSLNGLTSFSKFTLNGADQSATALPVELLYFDAKLLDKQNVLLEWATLTEINNDYFSLERSSDGLNFITISEVDGAGNYVGRLDYKYIDQEALQGLSYYRLKQTDHDGSFAYSEIRSINNSSTTSGVAVYPVPFKDYFSITIEQNEVAEFSIFDVSGKLVHQGKVDSENRSIDMRSFSSGLYLLRLELLSGSESFKLIKE